VLSAVIDGNVGDSHKPTANLTNSSHSKECAPAGVSAVKSEKPQNASAIILRAPPRSANIPEGICISAYPSRKAENTRPN